MDNHYHLIVRLNDNGKEVTQAFSNFFNSYAKSINKENDRTGSLFEKQRFSMIGLQLINP